MKKKEDYHYANGDVNPDSMYIKRCYELQRFLINTKLLEFWHFTTFYSYPTTHYEVLVAKILRYRCCVQLLVLIELDDQCSRLVRI